MHWPGIGVKLNSGKGDNTMENYTEQHSANNVYAINSQLNANIMRDDADYMAHTKSADPFENLYNDLEAYKKDIKSLVVALKHMKNNIVSNPQEPIDQMHFQELTQQVNDVASNVSVAVKRTFS